MHKAILSLLLDNCGLLFPYIRVQYILNHLSLSVYILRGCILKGLFCQHGVISMPKGLLGQSTSKAERTCKQGVSSL